MARLKWVYPIEEIHGALKKGVMGAAMRSTANNKGERFNFSVFYGKRDLTNKPLSADETAAREKFAAVRAAVIARKNNPGKRVTDQNAFKAQSTYKTMNAYLWSVCGAEYDAAHTEE